MKHWLPLPALALSATLALPMLLARTAHAQGTVNAICSTDRPWC